MNRYTVNFICKDNKGHNIVRSEELVREEVDEAIELVRKEWPSWDVDILWAGIRPTDNV
jgi:hypothetical protein